MPTAFAADDKLRVVTNIEGAAYIKDTKAILLEVGDAVNTVKRAWNIKNQQQKAVTNIEGATDIKDTKVVLVEVGNGGNTVMRTWNIKNQELWLLQQVLKGKLLLLVTARCLDVHNRKPVLKGKLLLLKGRAEKEQFNTTLETMHTWAQHGEK
ncbi:hypothetical protein V8G54_003588 [Vigna mungo]|uniref:Uncharacterized protein n=1 Tax=Vigna mungo TaxID=3915 RepID=A0AAQ3SAA1_VIGMU